MSAGWVGQQCVWPKGRTAKFPFTSRPKIQSIECMCVCFFLYFVIYMYILFFLNDSVTRQTSATNIYLGPGLACNVGSVCMCTDSDRIQNSFTAIIYSLAASKPPRSRPGDPTRLLLRFCRGVCPRVGRNTRIDGTAPAGRVLHNTP